ncbi:MAG: acetate/propionate family kinase [Syntrophothermus sp.]
MKIFVLNCGSSSIKYQLFDMKTETVLAKGRVERIGMDTAVLSHRTTGKEEVKQVASILEHATAIRKILEVLTDAKAGAIKSADEITAVGHRVVSGGEEFSESVLITDEVKAVIKQCFDLAPLHNPPNLMGINAMQAILPEVPQVAVFDTAFHSSMPPYAFLYAIPYILYKRYRVRRYGFHGTSHKFVSQRVAQLMKRPLEDLKIISCHLGNGASITAVKGGKSVDTTMGFTPVEGLVMGTRSGDLDPGALLYVMSRESLGIGDANAMLNKHSGLIGVSGISSDMREIEEERAAGNLRARDAFDMFVYRIRKYIGAYAAAMDGVDAIVFTAGVGENSPAVREEICRNLTFLGIELDEGKNKNSEKEKEITKPASKVKVYVIPTNEELVIARDTMEVASKALIAQKA